MRQAPIHYLRENDTTWTPPVVAVFDTETRWITTETEERHELRLWSARIVERRSSRKNGAVDRRAWGTTAEGLAEEITMWLRGGTSVWCYAHNLNFDLTTTQLPVHLTRDGWEVSRMALGGSAPHLFLTRGSKRLRLLDSHSLFPVALDVLADLVGIPKLPLPPNDAPEAEWLARCDQDVDATLTALLTLLDWWDAEQLGRFQSTGPGCGWTTYRHKLAGWKTLINPDEAQIRHDRAACYGGRRGVWRHGAVSGGPFAEIDLVSAYATVAAHETLPTARWVHYDQVPAELIERVHRWDGLLGTVVINTDRARWPCEVDGRVFYPVGTFRTVLAGPDLQEAHKAGAVVSCEDAWLHRAGEHMQAWGKWILDALDAGPDAVPPVARAALKGWSRTVVGRWSAHGWETTHWGPVTTLGWSMHDSNGDQPGKRGVLINLNGEPWRIVQTEAGEDCYPAVTAWVEAHCRSVLNRVIDLVGEHAVIQCDTDGLIVDVSAVEPRLVFDSAGRLRPPRMDDQLAALVSRINHVISPHRIRVKNLHDSVTVHGPQHYDTPTDRKRSGISRDADEVRPGTYVSYIWPALKWQLANSAPGVYTRPVRETVMAGPYATGWCLSDGRVIPVQVAYDEAGGNRIVPFTLQTVARPAGATLAPAQADWLGPYR